MSITVHCYEPQATPRAISITFESPEPFAVYALQDNLSEEARDMRTTIVRRLTDNPPPNSTLLMELEIRKNRPGELPTISATRVGARVIIELIRVDSRGRVAKGTELKSGCRLEATMRDLRTYIFSLEIESELVAKKAIASTRPTGSQAIAGVGSLLWIVPNIMETIAEPKAKIVAWLAKKAKRMGLSAALISPMILMSAVMMAGLAVGYKKYSEADAAREEMLRIEEEMLFLSGGQAAALAAEAECRTQRKVLARALDQVEESRMLQAEIAMSIPLSRSVAIERGGSKYGEDDVMAFDKKAIKAVHGFVVGGMATQKETDNFAFICMSQEPILGQDLPKYVLVYHPMEDDYCPGEFAAVVGGVDMAGPFGLSSRIAKFHGAAYDGEDDPRMNERWAANTLADTMRTIQEAILTAEVGERPSVAPGQLHQWTLAFLDAYNRLPSPANGAMDRATDQCVQSALLEVSKKYGTAEPGQPVLPDISLVAGGEPLQVTPTAGCPWPSDAINLGASSAMRAVTNHAVVLFSAEQSG